MSKYGRLRVCALVLAIACMVVSCAGSTQLTGEEVATQPKCGRELTDVGVFFWSANMDRLYFSSHGQKAGKSMALLRYYDLQTNDIVEIDTGSSSLTWFAINDCGEIAAIARDYDPNRSSIFLYMDDQAQTYSAPNVEIYGRPFWISDCDSAMLIFFGGGPETEDMFLWTKESSELKVLTLFDDKPLEEVRYSYRKFMKSSVKGRVIFDYYVNRRQGDWVGKTYNFGAMDVETGNAWKIISHGKSSNRRVDPFNWFCSKTEDALYFFVRDELYHLDSLWRIDSSGTTMTKVLDGQDIRNPYWYTVVSWSADASRFAFYVAVEEAQLELPPGIYLVDTRTKDISLLISDVDVTNFALSPDSQKIAYLSNEYVLCIFDISTGTKENIYPVD